MFVFVKSIKIYQILFCIWPYNNGDLGVCISFSSLDSTLIVLLLYYLALLNINHKGINKCALKKIGFDVPRSLTSEYS